MIVEIGYYAQLVALVLCLHVVLATLAGLKMNSANLLASARQGILACFAATSLAFVCLFLAFVTDDFSVTFVAENSSTDLPLFYKATAVWGGMDGSLLLWQVILSLFSAVVALRYAKTNREILPHTLVILAIIQLFLLFLLVGWSNPFAQTFPTPVEGRGLNPLLQHPGMVVHPPFLYLGYVGFSIPFAFAMGSLLRGKMTEDWILTTRRWTLFSWFFLTAGMVAGGNWAYVELGWGGYWAWDPVENSSLMPWLTGTALLHSVMVQEKRGSLKIWNLLLVIATFTLSVLGTFITRSGVLNSVHAFAKSNIGPAFLVFIALTLVFSHVLLFSRQHLFASSNRTDGLLCKENSFLLNNVLFVGMAFTVLYGTVFPLLAEGLADKKLSIQAPFFNSIMTPLGILVIFLMGLTHLLGWKKTSQTMLKKNMILPVAAMLVGGLGLYFGALRSWQLAFLGGMALFAGVIVVQEWLRSLKVASQGANKSQSTLKLLWRDRRRRGAVVIHFGVVIMLLGFCGNFFSQETSFSFGPGESHQVGQYKLTFAKAGEKMVRNARHVGLWVDIEKNGKPLGTLNPVKAFYPTSPEPMTEVAIYRTIVEDLYLSLSSMNQDGTATLNVYVNPLVNLVWASMGFYVVGILFALSYKPAQLIKQRNEHAKN